MTAAPLITIVGATATGKSHLALDLAQAFNGEVINADAMQFYQGMHIGTARISECEAELVPHHLLSHLKLTEEASVATYQEQAREIAQEIGTRGNLPLLVGGSGLYVRAVTDIMKFPGTDPKIRAALEARAAAGGVQHLYRELADLDPAAALAIEPRNERRVIRALEVIELTGEKFSANLPTYTYHNPQTLQIGLRASRPTLDERISARVHDMIEQGLVAEVRSLDGQGLRQGATAARAIGYQQILEYLDGNATLDAAIAGIIQATQRLVRRQETWFKRDPRITWITYEHPSERDHVLERAATLVTSHLGNR